MTALATSCAALTEAAILARRRRVRLQARSYDRARHILAALPELGDRPGHPLSRVLPCWLELDAHTTRRILKALCRRLRAAMRMGASGFYPCPEQRIDLLRIAIAGELANYARAVRRGELLPATELEIA